MTDWELWACAQQVLRQHGAKAPVFVAERIGALALAGDADGVAAWKAMGSRVETLGDYLSLVLQFSAKVGFENSLVGIPFGSFRRG